MLKLMKYELRKQMFSKIVMGIILAALTVGFVFATILENKDNAETMITLMVCVMIFAIFYIAIEGMLTFEKDLSTKQSYMLFLVPQTSKSILGAKMIVSIVQTLFTMAVFAGAIGTCGHVYLSKYNQVYQDMKDWKMALEIMYEIKIDVPLLLAGLSEILIVWVFMIMLGIFAITALNTVLSGKRWTTFLTVVLYFVLFYIIGHGEDMLVYGHGLSELAEEIICYVYYVIFDLLLFFATTWLMDKKLSV